MEEKQMGWYRDSKLRGFFERVKFKLVDVREGVVRGAVAILMMVYLLIFDREGYR